MSLNYPLDIGVGLTLNSAKYPNKVAVIDGKRKATYRKLNEKANSVSNLMLQKLGLNYGDKVSVLLHNSLEYIEIIYGLAKAGLVLVPINPKLAASEVEYILNHSDSKSLIYDAYSLATVKKINPSIPKANIIMVNGTKYDVLDYDELCNLSSNEQCGVQVREDDPFFIGYTSGTTGLPKGVVNSHRARVLTIISLVIEYNYKSDAITLATAPICHGAGMAFAIAPIYLGGTTCIMDSFDPEKFLYTVESQAINNVFMVPAMFHKLFSLPEETLDKYNNESLKVIISNAAPLMQDTKEKIIKYFSYASLHECYGSTEGGIVTNLRPHYQLQKERCAGQPFLMTEIKLLNDKGEEVEIGEVGELFSKSPFLFSEYYKMKAETEKSFHDGFFSAGDLAIKDEDGFYYIVDRKKDMILSGGVNIYPREIEEIIIKHANIQEVSVVGIPDERWGEIAVAYIVNKPGKMVTSEEISRFCKDKIAKFKVPKEVVTVNELPKNASGKVLKRVLKEKQINNLN